MDIGQFIIQALRDGGRIEFHGPGSTEADEHEQEEAEDGEGDEGEGEGEAPEGGEEPEAEGGPERRSGYNRAALAQAAGNAGPATDSVRAQLMRQLG